MSRTALLDVNGFTPVIDTLVTEVGLVTATVFGVVWRYCQMEDGLCWASQDKIGDKIGMSRQAISEHIKKLVQFKYLEEVGYGNNGVKKLFDTGKANFKFSITAVVQTDTACRPTLQPDVNQTDTKIDIKKEKDTTQRSKPITTLEPCDEDGVPDSWKQKSNSTKKQFIAPEVKAFAEMFSEMTGVKQPVLVSSKDYGAYAETWKKPIEAMLHQVDNNLTKAYEILEKTIDIHIERKLQKGLPVSIYKTFCDEVANDHMGNNKKRMAKDPDGNWREL